MRGVVAGNMAEKKTADTEAPKDEDRGLIHETMKTPIGPEHFLQGKAKRFAAGRARAPEGQDALHALKHRYVVVRHLAHA